MARIAAQAAELGTDLKQIVWALDTGRSSLEETLRFTAHYASTYCAQQGLNLHLHVQEAIPEISLSMEQRRNIFLVVKEALHNVVKHARATEVSVSMSCSDELAVMMPRQRARACGGGGTTRERHAQHAQADRSHRWRFRHR
ncbi:MAG: hypothetical protein IPJ85_07455, partial [Flavobacteriales bacterium]|nr:hypothetical protein [Flavobacteriales bacterium]